MRTAEEMMVEARRINETHFKDFINLEKNQFGFFDHCVRAVFLEEDLILSKLKLGTPTKYEQTIKGDLDVKDTTPLRRELTE